MYVFLPCDDGRLENEGLKVEENGRLVQRDVTLYLLSTRCLRPSTRVRRRDVFIAKGSFELVVRSDLVSTRGACTRANDLVRAAAEVMVRTNYSAPVYRTQHGAEVKPMTRLSRKIHVKYWSSTFQDTRGAGTA